MLSQIYRKTNCFVFVFIQTLCVCVSQMKCDVWMCVTLTFLKMCCLPVQNPNLWLSFGSQFPELSVLSALIHCKASINKIIRSASSEEEESLSACPSSRVTTATVHTAIWHSFKHQASLFMNPWEENLHQKQERGLIFLSQVWIPIWSAVGCCTSTSYPAWLQCTLII